MSLKDPVPAQCLEADRARWRSAVAEVLAKSTRRDPADLPAEPERLLDSPTYEGFPIRPLYTGLDALPEAPLPGQWPFVRGGDARRDVKSGWKVAEAFPTGGTAVADGNGAVLVALTEGVSALVLRVGRTRRRRAGRAGPPARGCLPRPGAGDPRCRCGLRRRRRCGAGAADRPGRRPAHPAVDGPGRRPADRAAERAVGAERRRRRGDRGEGRPDTTAGCVRSPSTARRSITWAPARHGNWPVPSPPRSPTCGCSARAASRVPDALRQISFRFAADDDQFMTIAKLRAARRLWARVAEVVGEPDAGAATVHAVTSLPMMAQRDPWVNMLRTTLAAFAAGVGGADTVLVQPFDVAIPGGFPGTAAGFRPAHRPQHPTAAAGGIPHRPGARPGRRIVVRRGPHRAAGRTGVEALPGHRIARRVRRGPRLRRRLAIAEVARAPDRRHRAPPHGAHRCQRVPESRGTAAAAR